MKLLILISTLSGGGAERAVSEISLHLPSYFEQILVLFNNKRTYKYRGKLYCLGTPKLLNRLPSLFPFSYIYKFLVMISLCINFIRVVNQEKPAVCMSVQSDANFINIFCNKLLTQNRSKAIACVHNTQSAVYCEYPLIYSLIHRLLITFFYNKSDAIIAVSNGVMVDLVNNFKIKKEKIEVIYNPVNINWITAQSSAPVNHKWFNDPVPVICNVGRLTFQKGQWHLIRVFSKVEKIIPCRLIIRGDGELKNTYLELIKQLNLEDKIQIIGWQENPFSIISKSKLFVNTSLFEGFPYVLLEAMACRTPIIATDCPSGPKELLGSNEFGYLVPNMGLNNFNAITPLSDSEMQLANAILSFLRDDSKMKKYSENGFLRIREFDSKLIITKYELLIKKIYSIND